MELSELFDQFAYSKLAEQCAPATVDWYGYHLRAFYQWLIENGESDILSPATIEQFLADRRTRGYAPRSVQACYTTLKVFYGWLREKKYIAESPVDEIRFRKPKKRTPRRVTRQEFDELIASIPMETWIDARDRLLIRVLFLAGLRVGEALQLRSEHFDCEGRQLLVPAGKTEPRVVPLLDTVIEAFHQYQPVKPLTTNLLFVAAWRELTPRDDALTPSGVRRMLRRRCEVAGIPYRNPHSFRHGMAVHLLNNSGDMTLVQAVLGHSSVKTTAEEYAEWSNAAILRNFTEKMR